MSRSSAWTVGCWGSEGGSVWPWRGRDVDPAGLLIDRRRSDHTALDAAGHEVAHPVRERERIQRVEDRPVRLVLAVAVDHVVAAVLAADSDDVDLLLAVADLEQVRRRAEGEVVVVDLARPPAPGGRAVEAQRGERAVVGRHRRRRHRGAAVAVGVAVARAEEQQAALRVEGGRRPDVAAAGRRAVEVAARAAWPGSPPEGRARPRCGSRRSAGSRRRRRARRWRRSRGRRTRPAVRPSRRRRRSRPCRGAGRSRPCRSTTLPSATIGEVSIWLRSPSKAQRPGGSPRPSVQPVPAVKRHTSSPVAASRA